MNDNRQQEDENQLFHDMCEEIVDFNTVVIYGAGQNAHAPLLWVGSQFSDINIEVHVAVSKKKNGMTFHGYNVEQIDELTNIKEKAVIMVSVFSGFFYEIKMTLARLGFTHVFYIDKWFYLEAYYNKYWEMPIQRNKILVENFHGRGYGDSPKYIINELIKTGQKSDIVWIISEGKEVSVPKEVRTVEIYSPEFFYETATAGVWISNVRKYQPVLKRKGQFYLQTWHGFTLKRIEKDAEDVSNGISRPYFDAGKKDSKMIDCLLSNSSFLTNIFKQTFWYDGEIQEIGTPRNDIFFRNNSDVKEKIKRYYGIHKNKRVLLYAPTFRSSYIDNPIDVDIEQVLDALGAKYNDDFVALIRMHPNIESKASLFDYSDRVINVTSYSDFMELLATSDVLLTDYSSAMFDFMFSDKPVFLYAKDLERYSDKDRGFYFDYNSLPFPISYNNQMLTDAIKAFDYGCYKRDLSKFISKMGFFEDGRASKRAADIVLGVMNISEKK